MTNSLQIKVDKAIKLLQSTCGDKEVELAYSGGKDSDVILELAKMAGVNYKAMYKNTTIDPPGTITHVREKGVAIIRPNETFLQLIERKGFPTRRARFCCQVLKEYKIMDIAIQGIRRSESSKRAKLYKEPILCRNYSKTNHVDIILPILDWTDNDVVEFITERGIKLHPLYYTEGEIEVKRRLGCMGCPLSKDKGLKEFKRYPNLVKAWLKAGEKWWKNHPNIKTRIKYRSIYEVFVGNLFFGSYEDSMRSIRGELFNDPIDCRKCLEGYFKINL